MAREPYSGCWVIVKLLGLKTLSVVYVLIGSFSGRSICAVINGLLPSQAVVSGVVHM